MVSTKRGRDTRLTFDRRTAQLPGAAFSEVRQLLQIIGAKRPDMLVVQGDTTSAFAAALAAYYAGVPVAHIEAGLRTYDPWEPFPEEFNRRAIAVVAALHFAPTPLARENLIREGVPRERVFTTGNTGIDALMNLLKSSGIDPYEPQAIKERETSNTVVITLHRRENQANLAAIFSALRRLAEAFPRHRFLYPVHPTPAIRREAIRELKSMPNFFLLPPVPYRRFVTKILFPATLVITDSGGIQEEAAHLGIPTLVLRKKTERPEGVTAGVATLVGSDAEKIFSVAHNILSEPAAWKKMARPCVLYGDGHATERIVTVIERFFGLTQEIPPPFVPRLNFRRSIAPSGKAALRPANIEEARRRVEIWLLTSGIQDRSRNSAQNGGVYCWYDEKEERYPFIYSEITGYYLSFCAYLHVHATDPQTSTAALTSARLAADWLINSAYDQNFSLMLTRYYLDSREAELSSAYSFKESLAYSFDNGMIVNGLVNLYKVTGDNRYLDMAKRIASSLIDRMQTSDGLFSATFSLKEKKPLDDLRVWSRHPGSHHVKLAIGFLELYKITGDDKFLTSATRIRDAALHYQHDNGRFEVFGRERDTYTHYHLYSIEGLLYIALTNPENKNGHRPLDAAYRAFSWLLQKQFITHTGGIASSYFNHQTVGNETADILAQTVRLGALFKSLGLLTPRQEQQVHSVVSRLLQFQAQSAQPSVAGGFYYGFGEHGEIIPHVNSWASMFAAQALDMFYRANNGEKISMDNFV
jgi:UDP-N-acetylglucosamine 2-epimerase (non-hydrolysing)